VSDDRDAVDDTPVLAGAGVHAAIVTRRARNVPDKRLADVIQL
jgi:hypothetical protein